MEAGAKPSGIAVIITVFNKEKFLRDAIDSVLTQNLGVLKLSVILCDDGSSDSSRSICAEYAARYPSVHDITDGEHRGVVGNFLRCLEYALSLNVQYISQLDSDDMIADPDFLLRQTTLLDSHPEAQAACSRFFLIGEKDTLADVRKISDTPQEYSYRNLKITPKTLLTKNNTLVAGGVTYRAEHLREYLDTFASTEDSTQDLPLWLFLSQKGSFWGTDTQSLAYRNLAESVSRSEDIETQLKFQQESLNTRLRFIKFVGLERLEPKARLLYQKKMLRHYAKLSPKAYAKQLKQAIKTNPSLLLSSDLWRSLGVYLKNR